MHISVEHGDNFATVHLRGEFDTYYCKAFLAQIDELIQGGVHRVVLNLRMVKFINSTALGSIVRAQKSLAAHGGRLVIAKPSPICRENIEKVGLDRAVPIFDSDEQAAKALFTGAGTGKPSAPPPDEDETAILFTPTDPARIEHFLSATRRFKAPANPVHGHQFGATWNGVGRMASLDEHGLRFTWAGGDTGLDVFAMGQLLAIGTELKVKFRLPLFKPGYCEATATVGEVEERDGGVKIGAAFTKIDDKTLAAVRQYAADLKFLKDELRSATGESKQR